ncbi:GGDEF domain-containing protein [Sinobaca sp. H24]|uniref:GGDEF domain-containing protein n=1 Tax=Sinobaca sp. H24 TaxID=2923376 RepID=UPI00207A9AFE|nr:diguanylate cyclase [Sinobaca sp. H24]
MVLKKSYSRTMFIVYCGMGLLMGIMFPIAISLTNIAETSQILLFSAACILAGLIVGFVNYLVFRLFIKRCTLPVLQTMGEIARGNLNTRIAVTSQDEIGQVFHSINHTIAELKVFITQANHDSLTGLPNRRFLEKTIASMLKDFPGHPLHLFFFDLDQFKLINDTKGHHTGDELLLAISARCQHMLKNDEITARLSGDEFVFVSRTNDPDSARRRLLKELSQPFILNEEAISVQASIGTSSYPEDGSTVTDLLKAADAGMYINKRERHPSFTTDSPLSSLSENAAAHAVNKQQKPKT